MSDDHSASRRVDVLAEEAPHLIAPAATVEIPAAHDWRATVELNLFSGTHVVGVSYQRAKGRRWERFVLVPDDDESYESVALKIGAAINAHMELT
jgi:NAD(P)-dependent dehydrogenase (short-subunit alcohol dehydrogenase family)